VQQSNAVLDTDLVASIQTAAMMLTCISQLSCQIVLRSQLPAKRVQYRSPVRSLSRLLF
jgi:hypothetical protein